MTHFSPCVIGRMLTRRSTWRPCTIARMRPSCGSRRSEISRFAMIFRRDTIAGCNCHGAAFCSKRIPSMR